MACGGIALVSRPELHMGPKPNAVQFLEVERRRKHLHRTPSLWQPVAERPRAAAWTTAEVTLAPSPNFCLGLSVVLDLARRDSPMRQPSPPTRTSMSSCAHAQRRYVIRIASLQCGIGSRRAYGVHPK